MATPVSWQFDLKFLEPRRIQVMVPGKGEETFWYMVYTVTNTSDSTQPFFPRFQIVTDDLKVYDTDMGIERTVFDAIRERHKLTHPYLVPPSQAIGDLKVGDDNARESVAIWRNVEMPGENFTIYVTGLSGETLSIKNPTYDPKQPEVQRLMVDGREREVDVNPRRFTLRKTLELRYRLPAAGPARYSAEPERVQMRWIMR